MMYIDKNTIPYECNIDRRYYINSVDAAYCKVFTGSVLTGGENVISCVYDQAGNLITNNVELELVNMPNGQNFIVTGKQIGRASCRERVLRLV